MVSLAIVALTFSGCDSALGWTNVNSCIDRAIMTAEPERSQILEVCKVMAQRVGDPKQETPK